MLVQGSGTHHGPAVRGKRGSAGLKFVPVAGDALLHDQRESCTNLSLFRHSGNFFIQLKKKSVILAGKTC